MSVLVVGGGIGGLTTALALHELGIRDVTVLEASREIRELGVGINTLPHAIRALRDLGLLDALDAVALRTAELFYLNRQGQQICTSPAAWTRGTTSRSSRSTAGCSRGSSRTPCASASAPMRSAPATA